MRGRDSSWVTLSEHLLMALLFLPLSMVIHAYTHS